MMKRHIGYLTRRKYTQTDGTSDVWQVQCEAIGKSKKADCPYVVPNEWISANIAHFLQLPVPPFSLMRKQSAKTAMFASYNFEQRKLSNAEKKKIDPAICYKRQPDICTGILLFDILIANCDRHRGNLGVDNPLSPKRIFAIDHGHALFYIYAGEGKNRLRSRADRLGISNSGNSSNQDHCLANVIDSSKFFAMWTQRIASIPDWFIESICREVQGQGVNKSEVDEAIDFLNHRKQNLGQLVLSKKKRFQEITDFPVIL